MSDVARPAPDDYSNRELARRVREIAMEYCTGEEEKILLEAAYRLDPPIAPQVGLTTKDMNAHARDV